MSDTSGSRTLSPPAVWRGRTCSHIGPEGQWTETDIRAQLSLFSGWQYLPPGQSADGRPRLFKRFLFPDFNAMEPVLIRLLTIARMQDHHPDVQFGYRDLTVSWNTHSAGGLSDNDWICAALLEEVAATVSA